MSDELRKECEAFLQELLCYVPGAWRLDTQADLDTLNKLKAQDLDALLRLCRQQQAKTWREAAKLAFEQSPHHMECALKWGRKCEQKAKEIEHDVDLNKTD